MPIDYRSESNPIGTGQEPVRWSIDPIELAFQAATIDDTSASAVEKECVG